jgi:3-oxoacyl-[acyl-carrier protein] reductase
MNEPFAEQPRSGVQPAPRGRLEGRVALVTGAGRGIGRAVAELFAREGARVMVATRSEAPGRETVEAIKADGGDAALHVVDVRTRSAVRETVQATLAAFHRLDVVVHNAYAGGLVPVWEMDDETLDSALDVNLKAAFWLTAEAVPALEKNRGSSILVVSSLTGNRQCQPLASAYGASKAGLNGFTRMAATELGPKGIRVNCVEPGVTETDGIHVLPDEELARFATIIPLGHLGEAIDIAYALLFLASEEAKHITGQVISVDGGQHLAPNHLG